MSDSALAKIYPVSSHSSLVCLLRTSWLLSCWGPNQPYQEQHQYPRLEQMEACNKKSISVAKAHVRLPAFLLGLLLTALNRVLL